MTYEVVGSGRAGETLRLPDGALLTLADRVARHLTTSLTTVATAAAIRGELLADFVAGRQQAAAEPGRTYLWEPDQPEAAAAARLLELHGVGSGVLPATEHYRCARTRAAPSAPTASQAAPGR